MSGDLDAADQLVTEINILEPGRPDLMRLMKEISKGRETQRRDASKKSRTPTKKAVGATPTATPTPTPPKPEPTPAAASGEDPKQIYNEGIKTLSKGDFQKAIDIFNRCVKVDPKFCYCHRALGITYAKSGNGPKAARYYRQFLKACPDAKDADAVRELLKTYENSP